MESEDRDYISKQITKELQATGIIRDVEVVQEAAKPVKIPRISETNDTVSVVTAEELNGIISCALETVTDSVNRIRGGEVSPRPVKDGAESSCTYCEFSNGCKYDSTIPGCRIAEIDHHKRIEFKQK